MIRAVAYGVLSSKGGMPSPRTVRVMDPFVTQ